MDIAQSDLEKARGDLHKAGIENENTWADLQRAEATVVQLRRKQQLATLRALQAQMQVDFLQAVHL